MADPLARGGKKNTLRGKRTAKRRGIVTYRVIVPKPGVYIRVAITRKRGRRGGRTIATSIIRKTRRIRRS